MFKIFFLNLSQSFMIELTSFLLNRMFLRFESLPVEKFYRDLGELEKARDFSDDFILSFYLCKSFLLRVGNLIFFTLYTISLFWFLVGLSIVRFRDAFAEFTI